jgi:WD40 repeat protein
MGDLSDYELIRAENIARNEQFLREIGMDEVTSELASRTSSEVTKRGVTGKRKAPALPERRSSRVTIERLKGEDFSLLPEAERRKKEEELAAMIQAKTAATFSFSSSAEGGGDDERWTRFSPEPIPALPPYNQPEAGSGRGEEDDKELEKERASQEFIDWGRPILRTLAQYSTSPLLASPSQSRPFSRDAYWSSTRALRTLPADVAKVAENRITAVWVHPSEQRLLVAAGDKSGYLGLWDVDAEDAAGKVGGGGGGGGGGRGRKGQSALLYGDKYASDCGVGGVFKYRPHVGNVARIFSYPTRPSGIHTVSYDGSVRVLDIESDPLKPAFAQRFCAPEGLEEMWFTDACEYMSVHGNAHAASPARPAKGTKATATADAAGAGAGAGSGTGSQDMLFVSRSDGYVCLIDFRARGGTYAWSFDSGYKVQSVQHWPTDENLILTAHAGKGAAGDAAGSMNVWDIRKVGGGGSSRKASSGAGAISPVLTFSGHSKSINAAYASPDGRYVLSVSQDNTIRCWGGMHEALRTGAEAASGAAKKSAAGGGGGGGGSGGVRFTSKAHDNVTGRWLSTFRPQWDPKHPHAFLLGSMSQPRCLELFEIAEGSEGTKEKETQRPGDSATNITFSIAAAYVMRGDGLNSVVSRNYAHPTQHIIAAANSSGRVHVFR